MKLCARLFVTLVLAGVAGLLFGRIEGSGQSALLALSQYLPFPAYLVPALAAVLVAFIWLGWVWRSLAVLALVASLTLLMGLSWGAPEEGHGRVRFMTYNVKSYLALNRPGGTDELAHEIIEHQPDILVMQDAGQLVDVEGNVKSADLLRVVGGGWQHAHANDEYVLLSRWPIRQCRHGAIPVGDEPHVFAHCDIDVEGTTLQVITVHLITPRKGLVARHRGQSRWLGLDEWQDNMLLRMRQAGLLAEYLRQLPPGPRIVAGDLNATEPSLVEQTLLNTGLRDAFSSASVGYGFTHGHSLLKGLSFLRIDHILVSPEIAVADAFTGGTLASQHRPVIADLYLHRH
ncbi:endonuclease/exonuclease/phosphatase family protein [Aquabacterium parvum]|jgi:endonuclease/exonuclease/phosphatase family metal-dependent hydrolase|uniref:endonuclease/exonuclease/phosphatase family protein n=1 Tax=Aquabacterium parvum TaxID=70584 RepID=UPI00128F52E5|nr:endonuclease/exonuclease/phosphatase family protein [Aquabacterium parvum]MBU0917423.1 endonuclease/exonuclease/phosphatase family protein [Gammaproteobacteria bacterium]